MKETKENFSSMQESMSKKELILIIEDDDFFRNLVAKKIEERGYRISKAKDGEEGLKKIKRERPDLVFLSLILPEMNGLEVLRMIKYNPVISSIPVVILSNLGELKEISTALEIGADDYLVKVNSTPELFVKRIKGNLR